MTTREDIEQERAALKQRYGTLYDEILALLFRHDPMGINYETNTDEYDPEVRPILPRLSGCSSATDVVRVVHEEFLRMFDPVDVGALSRYEPIAAEIWDLWSRHTQR